MQQGAALTFQCAMQRIDFAKNQENYFVIKVDGEEVEDHPDLVRSLWRCTEDCCPFPGCSDSAWKRVKSDLWSVDSEDMVRCYIKQHGMESILHGRAKVDPLPEDRVDSFVRDADIQMSEDTWQDRQEYKKQVNSQEQGRKRKREKQDDSAHDQWHDSGSHSSNWRREPEPQNEILESLAKLTEVIKTATAPGKEPLPVIKALMTGPSSSEIRAVPSFIETAMRDSETLDDGSRLSVNEKMVSVPFSTLMLCKETTTRSKEACKQALASMLTPMNQLRIELGVLSNAESVLDQLIANAKNS